MENPILIIDDDAEDLELITEAFKELKIENELLCFEEADQALDFLRNCDQQPLFILCDVNMNTTNGFELRKSLQISKTQQLTTSLPGQKPIFVNK